MSNFKHYRDVIAKRIPPKMSSLMENRPGQSRWEDFRNELRRLSHPCSLCFRRCGAARHRGETGYCGIDMSGRMILDGIFGNEEEPLNPTYEVFLAGCNLRCGFCYQWDHIVNPAGIRVMSPEEMTKSVRTGLREGAKNLHWVGGEPTVHLPWIVNVLSMLHEPVPVIWNSNMTMTRETLLLIETFTDVVLADIHFGSETCALRICKDASHIAVARSNVEYLAGRTGLDMILRLLLLPGHFHCCTEPLLRWVRETIPGVTVHLMPQYLPPSHHRTHVPRSPLTRDEFRRAQDLAVELDLKIHTETPGGKPAAPPARRDFENEIIIHPGGGMTILYLSGDFENFVEFYKNSPHNDNRVSGKTTKGRQ